MTGTQIAEAIDKIIEEIPKQHRRNMGAINWGDLGVREVRMSRSVYPEDEGEEAFDVLIEEADPANSAFTNYIWERFNVEFGHHGHRLNIRTEW